MAKAEIIMGEIFKDLPLSGEVITTLSANQNVTASYTLTNNYKAFAILAYDARTSSNLMSCRFKVNGVDADISTSVLKTYNSVYGTTTPANVGIIVTFGDYKVGDVISITPSGGGNGQKFFVVGIKQGED